MSDKLAVAMRVVSDNRHLTLKRRDAWAHLRLREAEELGCSSIDHPGPRWSGYVHKLRHRYRLTIETPNEAHTGPFPGNHARYILRTAVEILPGIGETKERAA